MNPAPRFYKPVAIRSPFLALFCAITLTVFVLLQLVPASDQSPTACEGCASSPPNSSPSAPPPSNFTVFTSFTSASYFLGAYFPTLVGVLYSMLWEVAHMQMMQMEPFFQLATRGGGGRLFFFAPELRFRKLASGVVQVDQEGSRGGCLVLCRCACHFNLCPPCFRDFVH